MAIASFTPRRAYATGAIIAVFLVTARRRRHPGRGRDGGRMSQVAPLLNPFVLLDGTRDWLVGDEHPGLAGRRRARRAAGLRRADGGFHRDRRSGAVLWRYRRIAA